jgi:hypothetical protein
MVTVNGWPSIRIGVTGTFLTGDGPNARGILTPVIITGASYWYTEHSFEEGREQQNFSLKQGHIHPFAQYGLKALGKYAQGEISTVAL